ncbi:MAG: response regulator [Bdellovibrionales bacterium]|nr:response regulator [Bdellovibrionales bacterium]
MKRKFAILVVDDDPKIRELVQAYFLVKNEDVTCAVASDVQQAILKLSNQEFDMIVIDNIMPIKNGIDFAIHLKRSAKYSKMAIVLMSGALQQSDVLKAVEAGIKDVLVKPFSLKQLGEKISPYFIKYQQS